MYLSGGKRLLDLVLAAAAALVLAPVIGLVALVVRASLGRPILFRQHRPGKDGRLFTMYKFRTMTEERSGSARLCPDEQRLTRLGRALRAASLDELPQLWNVLCGEMSLVGPRPLLAHYLPQYSPRQMRRHLVRPGITGLAQVSGRNALDWNRRLELDAWYAEHVAFWLDMKVLARTVVKLVSRQGVHAEGHATMPEFAGSRSAAATEPQAVPDSRRVFVVGAGGHAKVVIATLEANGWSIGGVYDDNPALWNQQVLGHRIQGPVSKLADTPGVPAVIAVGNPSSRRRLARLPLRWVSAVHPAASVHKSVRVGEGTVVFAGAVVQPDVVLAKHAVINTGASVDHDGVIGNFVNVGPGARLAGEVQVGDCSDLGTGCVVIPRVRIGDSSVVAAGAVVVRDVPDRVLAVGCPARTRRVNLHDRTAQNCVV